MILDKDGILHPLSVELSVDKNVRDNVPVFNFGEYCLQILKTAYSNPQNLHS